MSTSTFVSKFNIMPITKTNIENRSGSILVVTVRKRSCRKIMLSQVCVKNSVHRGGEVYTSLGRHPFPWADTPRAETPLDRPPLGRHPHGQTPLGRHPPTPLGRHLTWADTLLGRHPPIPLGRHPPFPRADTPSMGKRLLQRTVRILLEFILVCL